MGPMGISGRAWLGVATLLAAGCADSTEPRLTISSVSPQAAYSDATVSLVIDGGPFRPIYDVDTSASRASIELGAFTAFLVPSAGGGMSYAAKSLMWINPSELAAALPLGIPQGLYDVEVIDPRGQAASKPGAFMSLGNDSTPPVVMIDEPPEGTIVNPGAEVPVAFEADDGLGYLGSMGWKVSTADMEISSTCSIGPSEHKATCRFPFVVPQPTMNGQLLNVTVTASDDISTNPPALAQITLGIGLPPTVDGFEPSEGPATGGTTISVHGSAFIAGTEVLVGGAPLDKIMVVSDTLIQGTTLAHDPGKAALTVRTGAISVDAQDTFTFVARPDVRAVAPTSGPSAGCTPVAIVGEGFRENPMTRIWFGSDTATGVPLECPTWVSASRIEGYAPPGAGAVSVFAGDPTAGVGELPLAYTYLDVDTPDAAAAACPCAAAPPPDGGAP
jgi:hypothetical protein